MITVEVLVPLLNANEPEARVAAVHVREGQWVERGALLFTIETTKAATDIESPGSGFFRPLVAEGEMSAVGRRLAVLTEAADEPLALVAPPLEAGPAAVPGSTPRLTSPARRLAETLGVELSRLPLDRLVTEEVVRQVAAGASTSLPEFPASPHPYLLIFGGGGHARTVIDLVRQVGGYTLAGVLDDALQLKGSQVLGLPVLGGRELLPALRERGIGLAANCVGGIVDINVRVHIFEALQQAGFTFPSLVHPRATVEPTAVVGEGVQVMANAYLGSQAVLEARCMVNTNAVVSHDCLIGSGTHVAPGALLAGGVQVGERTLIGMGVTTAVGIRIGARVRIGNGAILLADVPEGTVIQAGRFWTGK